MVILYYNFSSLLVTQCKTTEIKRVAKTKEKQYSLNDMLNEWCTPKTKKNVEEVKLCDKLLFTFIITTRKQWSSLGQVADSVSYFKEKLKWIRERFVAISTSVKKKVPLMMVELCWLLTVGRYIQLDKYSIFTSTYCNK